MGIEAWLKSLPDDTSRYVRIDLDNLYVQPFSFLETDQVVYQIERLSTHLGSQPSLIRQAAIRYSLYIRQLDAIQERKNGTRQICTHACQRPPVGCCNSEHYIILPQPDPLLAKPSHNSLHLAAVLTALQNQEYAFALAQGRLFSSSSCSHLTATGCSLRLFKSPRCIHYLCPQVALAMIATHGDSAADFLAAMHDSGNRVILTLNDFINYEVIQAAEILFVEEESIGLA